MAQSFDIQIEDNTPEFKKALEDAIPVILEEWGLAVEGFAIDAITDKVYNADPAPTYKRTGRLRASITYATQTNRDSVRPEAKSGDAVSGSPAKNEVFIGTNVEYAAYVEMGTSKMLARPFIRPAVSEHISDLQKIAENRLKNA